MHVIDSHCDTLLAIASNKDNQALHFSYEKVKSTGFGYLQFFAMFLPPSIINEEKGIEKSEKLLKTMLDIYNGFLKEEKFKAVLTKKDIDAFLQGKDLYSLLSFEGIYLSNGNLDYIDMLYNIGVRSLSFTWNPSNEFAGGAGEDSNKGLTKLGFEAVERCNDLGILLDVSHASDASFYDILESSTKPVVATHSNCRAINKHFRNLTDDMLKQVAKSGGVAGINFFSDFLVSSDDKKQADISDVIKHIEHIASVVGIEYVAFGTDFDGISRPAVPDVTYIPEIINNLLKLNYTEEQVRMLSHKNMARVLKEVLP